VTDRLRPTGDHRPHEDVVRALAMDVAIDARRHHGAGPSDVEPLPEDELADLAQALAVLAAEWWGDRTLPDGHGLAPRVGPWSEVVPLSPVSLVPPAPARRRAGRATPGGRAGGRRLRREALAGTAGVAALVALIDLGLPGPGGHHPPATGLALPATSHLAMVDDRLQLAPSAHPSSGSGLSRLTAVACPSAPRCVGVADATGGATIAISADGGRTWVRREAPSGVTGLAAVTCATPEHCWAVGSSGRAAVVLATTDGGGTWVRQSAPQGVVSLDAVSCPAAARCWAVGTAGGRSAIVATTDGGATWLRQSAPLGVVSLDSVSCPTVVTCWAGGSGRAGATVVTSDDGGRTWGRRALPSVAGTATVTRVAAVTCPTVAACWAAGTGADGSVIAFSVDAKGWTTTASVRAESVAGTRWAPLCRRDCAVAPPTGPWATERAVEGPGAGAVSDRTAGGALTCPTTVQCWSVRAAGTGFTADAVDLS